MENKFILISKKLISFILAVIIGLGTFVSMMTENVTLLDIIHLRNAFTAFADDDPVPGFYRENELVGLYNPDYQSTDTLYYSLDDGDNWIEYSHPFSIPAYQTTEVCAKIGENGAETADEFTSVGEAIGAYTESCTDFTISQNKVVFDFSRYYNSKEQNWFISLYANAKAKGNNIVEVQLPNSTKLTFVRTGTNTYKNELSGYELTKDNNNYYLEINGITYGMDSGMLTSITDTHNNEITFYQDPPSLDAPKIHISGQVQYEYSDMTLDIDAPVGEQQYETIKDPAGNYIYYFYGSSSFPDKVKDQAGRVIAEYNYTNNGYLLSKSSDKTIHYYTSGDNEGRISSIVCDSGETVTYTYSDSNKSFSTHSLAGTTTTVYNDAFLPVSYTDESGTTTTYTYNDKFEVVSTTTNDNESSESTNYTYYDNGLLKRSKEGDVYTYYQYNNDGELTLTATYTYSGENAPAEYSSNMNCDDVTMYSYDNKGRVSQESTTRGNDSETTGYSYDSAGNATSVQTQITEGGETTTINDTYTYDVMGNVLTSTSNNETTEYTYDEAGRTLLVKEPGNKYTRTVFDNLGRVVQEIGPEQYNSSNDGLPNQDSYSDNTVGTRYTYNNANQLVSEINPLNVETTYTYHNNGVKATEHFDKYTYNYNEFGNISTIVVAGTGNASSVTYATYGYDNNQRNTSIAYANGQTVYYSYNSDGNVTSQSYKADANSETVTQFEYTYDSETKKLTQKLDHRANLRTTYASDGTVKVYDISAGGNGTQIYEYKDSTETETQNGNEVTTRTLDKGMMNIFCNNNLPNYSSPNTVTSTGNNHSIALGNNVCYNITDTETDGKITNRTLTKTSNNTDLIDCDYTYDNDGNITQISYGNISVSYVYDNKGRISQKTATGLYNNPMVQNFHYDSKGQLVRCDDTKKNKSTVYNYDSRGNMTSKEDFAYTNPENAIPSQATPTNEATYDFEYDDNVWLDSVQNTSENLVYNGDYIYDENGNVLNVDYEEFHWTNGRELERIDYHMLDDSRIVYASYTYDENGLRTSKTRSDYTTKYIYDGDKLLAEYEEYTVNGTCWHCKEYLYDGNDEMVGYKCDNNVFFFLKDAEGDVIGLVDSSNGNVVEKYSYDPWGAVTGANANSQRYNSIYYRGYYYDIDDSRYYLQSRYYKPQWGSFINADLPEIAQQSKNEVNGLNLFTYCNNDPINNVDPTGFLVYYYRPPSLNDAICRIKAFEKRYQAKISIDKIKKQKFGNKYYFCFNFRLETTYKGIKQFMNDFGIIVSLYAIYFKSTELSIAGFALSIAPYLIPSWKDSYRIKLTLTFRAKTKIGVYYVHSINVKRIK